MPHLSKKSQLLPTGLDTAAPTLTEDTEDNWTPTVACMNARAVVLYVDWDPGDEDYIEIVPVWNPGEPVADKEGYQFYRSLRQNDAADEPEVGQGKLLRVRQDALDEQVDNPADLASPAEPKTHYFAARFDPRGRYVKFSVRVGMLDEALTVLSAGTVKLHHALEV